MRSVTSKVYGVVALAMFAIAGAGILASSSARAAEAAIPEARKCTHTRCLTPDICVYNEAMACGFTGPGACTMSYCDGDDGT